jgi:HJR/Mrr/RecB family endonuclease
LSAQGKGVESVLEWGGVIAKIAQSAGFYRCDKIVLVVQENEYYHHLVEGLRSQTQIEVEEVVVPSDEKNTNKP